MAATTIGAVLPGGGTRGAYEAGALSVLLPALEAQGEDVRIWCGTSVGALNTALFASLAHRPAAERAGAAVARWSTIRESEAIRPIVGPGLVRTALRYLGDAFDVPGVRLDSLLDPAPLRRSLQRWVNWEAIERNVADGVIDAVGVIATSLAREQAVAFVDAAGSLPADDPTANLAYAATALGPEHVLASAAIPLVFPAVHVSEPEAWDGWYVDGGTRVNTPIKPVLDLGADRVLVIGFEPFGARPVASSDAGPPDFADVLANILEGLLLDSVDADLRRLGAVNTLLAAGARTPRYREVEWALVCPRVRGEIGAIAERVYRRRYEGPRGLLRPDYPFLSRLLGGRSRSRGELLSFLLFDDEFARELVALGRRDAERWLERHPGVWARGGAEAIEREAAARPYGPSSVAAGLSGRGVSVGTRA